MMIYIVELILIWFLGIQYYRKAMSNKMFVIMAFTMMALVLGLRSPSVGEDTKNFIDIFHYAKDISWQKALTSGLDVIYKSENGVDRKIEVGYIVFNKIVAFFTDHGQWMIFIVAVLTCWLFGKFILDNCKDVFFSTYILMCESIYMHSFSMIRQILALAIALQAFKYIRKDRIVKGILIITGACLIHKAAVVLLILIPLGKIKRRQKALKWIFLGDSAVVLSIPMIQVIVSSVVPRYASYFTTNYWASTLGMGSIALMVIELAICSCIYYKTEYVQQKIPFLTVSCTSLAITFDLIGARFVAFSRIALMFKVFLIYLFPMSTKFFSKAYKEKYQLIIMIGFALTFLSYASVSSRQYSFFWQ